MVNEELSAEEKKVLKSIGKRNLSAGELERILKSVEKTPQPKKTKINHNFGKHAKFGVISDTHIGQKEFKEPLLKEAGRIFKKEGIEVVYHVGDHVEGMSGRDGQIYELTHLGFEQQVSRASELYNKYLGKFKIFGIDGNHDQWYVKKGNQGAVVGEELERRLDNYTHLGPDEGDVKLSPNVRMKLFHAGDGTAYAVSYKMQKLMESFTGGDKPNILLSGHYHKALYFFNRNIHGIEAGTLCGQTSWMRGKKIPAHTGFWTIDVEMGKKGIGKFSPTFYADYD